MRQKKVVLWGAGSKGVAFLSMLNVHNEIEYAVDINPYKKGTYMAGTGHQIVGPEILKGYRPDIVIVMNPIYSREIRETLRGMGLDKTELLTVNLDQRQEHEEANRAS